MSNFKLKKITHYTKKQEDLKLTVKIKFTDTNTKMMEILELSGRDFILFFHSLISLVSPGTINMH